MIPLPKVFNVQIGDKMMPIHLVFGTFFGAYFKCNKHGHFSRECPLDKKNAASEHVNKVGQPLFKDKKVVNSAIVRESSHVCI